MKGIKKKKRKVNKTFTDVLLEDDLGESSPVGSLEAPVFLSPLDKEEVLNRPGPDHVLRQFFEHYVVVDDEVNLIVNG